MDPSIEWLGHASFKIMHRDIVVYVDPWKIDHGPKADMVLITHPHEDHFSIDDIRKVQREDTWIMAPKGISSHFKKGIDLSPRYWKDVPLKQKTHHIRIEGHAAYNIDKQYHPISKGWLGYVIELDGFRVYHSGDTDLVPEMEGIKNVDVALLAVGGKFTMGPEEAAGAAAVIGPKKAIPMHWGDIVGTLADAERFRDLCSCEVRIPEKRPWWYDPRSE